MIKNIYQIKNRVLEESVKIIGLENSIFKLVQKYNTYSLLYVHTWSLIANGI